ncbi:hypothetical protein HBI56_136190 [Parastagonospora nodorum]|nr:hypothetical protein HBH52_241900 [Parastagonospora nodorum]KAH4234335.1 hypothetical protein HBI05_156840 [Parastagonospora nodorum]KAH4244169.1 hypothetical protein HBI06_003590 [Parastagonospora nodorum]KAH4300546.1 hypothetical protein HBI02_148470 [Parastagonospora nodorum]KAH4306906.1 hypothetical protein HBI01_056430 [Parastagonospora nodorum]
MGKDLDANPNSASTPGVIASSRRKFEEPGWECLFYVESRVVHSKGCAGRHLEPKLT